jgi:hypothetical protein
LVPLLPRLLLGHDISKGIGRPFPSPRHYPTTLPARYLRRHGLDCGYRSYFLLHLCAAMCPGQLLLAKVLRQRNLREHRHYHWCRLRVQWRRISLRLHLRFTPNLFSMELAYGKKPKAHVGSHFKHGLCVSKRFCPLQRSWLLNMVLHSASIAVTVRMGYLMNFKSPDFLWDTLDVAVWSDIEQGLAITAGSLATLRPLYRDVTKFLLGWTDAAPNTFPSERKDSRKWYRTPSVDHHKKSGPISLVSITRVGNEEMRRSGESDGNFAARTGKSSPTGLSNDLGEANEKQRLQFVEDPGWRAKR